MNSLASATPYCGQTSSNALTACGRPKVHATCKTETHPAQCGPDTRARIELSFFTDGAAEEHCSTIGVVPHQLAIHVGALVDQRIQVSVSPLATVACDWHPVGRGRIASLPQVREPTRHGNSRSDLQLDFLRCLAAGSDILPDTVCVSRRRVPLRIRERS